MHAHVLADVANRAATSCFVEDKTEHHCAWSAWDTMRAVVIGCVNIRDEVSELAPDPIDESEIEWIVQEIHRGVSVR